MPGKLLATNSLSLLASAYSDSESEEDEPEAIVTDETCANVNETIEKITKEKEDAVNACHTRALQQVEDSNLTKVIENPDPTMTRSEVLECQPALTAEEPTTTESEPLVEQAVLNSEVNAQLGSGSQHVNGLSMEMSSEGAEIEILAVEHSSADFNADKFTAARTKIEPESDSSDSDLELLDSNDDSDCSDDDSAGKKDKPRPPLRVKGELLLSDLPPIEDLHISIPHEQCEAIGVIKSVVDSLVVVESYPSNEVQKYPALNLDTVLFLDEGDRALGHIFDVFGPVTLPHYCVRFNSKDHISSRGVKIGMIVYCAPKTKYTTYVFLAQLRQLRGTDASWQDDIEPPPEEQDFSDDEAEKKKKNKNRNGGKSGGIPRGGGGDRRSPDSEQINGAYKAAGCRGRKRYADNTSVNNSRSFTPQPARSHFVPPYVPGFFPPSWRHQGFQAGQFNPGYGSRFGSCPPMPVQYYPSGPHPSMYNHFVPPQSPNTQYLQNMRHSSNSHPPRVPFNYYPPPPPPPPATGQTFYPFPTY